MHSHSLGFSTDFRLAPGIRPALVRHMAHQLYRSRFESRSPTWYLSRAIARNMSMFNFFAKQHSLFLPIPSSKSWREKSPAGSQQYWKNLTASSYTLFIISNCFLRNKKYTYLTNVIRKIKESILGGTYSNLATILKLVTCSTVVLGGDLTARPEIQR